MPTSFRLEHDGARLAEAGGANGATRGVCEVVVFTQDADATLGTLPLRHVGLLVDLWADRYEELARREDVAHELGDETPGHGWLDYVQSVTAALAHRSMAVGGFETSIESTIPVGAGVSSSAALEVSPLRELF